MNYDQQDNNEEEEEEEDINLEDKSDFEKQQIFVNFILLRFHSFHHRRFFALVKTSNKIY